MSMKEKDENTQGIEKNDQSEQHNGQPRPHKAPTVLWVADSHLEVLMASEGVKYELRDVPLKEIDFSNALFQTRFGHVDILHSHVNDIASIMVAPEPVFKRVLLSRSPRVKGGWLPYQIVAGRHRVFASRQVGLDTVGAYVVEGTSPPSALRAVSVRSNFAQLGETEADRLTGALLSSMKLGTEARVKDLEEVATFWRISVNVLKGRYRHRIVKDAAAEFGTDTGDVAIDVVDQLYQTRGRPALFPSLCRYAVEIRPTREEFRQTWLEASRLIESKAVEYIEARRLNRGPESEEVQAAAAVNSRVQPVKKTTRRRAILGHIARLAEVNKYLAVVENLEQLDASHEETQHVMDLCSDIIKQVMRIRRGRRT